MSLTFQENLNSPRQIIVNNMNLRDIVFAGALVVGFSSLDSVVAQEVKDTKPVPADTSKVEPKKKPDEQFYAAYVLLEPKKLEQYNICLLYTSPSPRDRTRYRMPSSA